MGCFSRIKTSDPEVEIGKKGLANSTWISNQTPQVIVFRDKYRNRFGRLRHSVAPFSDKIVAVDTAGIDTYYQMGLLVRDAAGEGSTDICVDTDDLLVYNKIIVCCEGEKLVLKKTRRREVAGDSL